MPRAAATPARPITPLAYTVNEALTAVPIGRTLLYQLISRGELRTVMIGGRRLIPAAALEELITKAGDAA